MIKTTLRLACIATLALACAPAFGQDTLKVAVGQRGLWDTAISDIGQRAGIFKKHGLTLEILYTQGAGETQQAVISGGVEIGVGAGVMGVLSAYSKGAPVRVIGAEITGAGDLYWYVKANSPIKTLNDTNGKSIAYSTNGSSTHGVVTAFIKQYGALGQRDRDRRAPCNAHGRHVRTGRCRLGGASVRSRSAGPQRDPQDCHWQ